MKTILLIFLVASLIIAFNQWLKDKSGCGVILSFNKFHSYWKKSPDSWKLSSGWTWHFGYVHTKFIIHAVGFTFIGWIQYRLWKLLHKKFERDESLKKERMEFEKLMEDENGT